ncbi:amino acid adenylation domain-containing protein [Streptomyces halstedii]|uniref:amino acid adenylation domain-containing protein n=1 Tax=Streptomyces halstedii TaxID=1944 RepID=UPI0037F226E8
MPRQSFLHHLFADSAGRAPDAAAVLDGPRVATYREIEERANRTARFLIASGIGREDVVGVRLPAGADCTAAVLGVWRAGAAVVPPVGGADAAGVRLDAVLLPAGGRTGAAATGPDATGRDSTDPARALVLDPDAVAAFPADDPALDLEPTAAAWVSPAGDGPGALVLDHRTLANQVRWLVDEYGVTGTDRVLYAPDGRDAPYWTTFTAFTAGASFLAPHTEGPSDPAGLPVVLAEQRVTVLVATPDTLTRIAADERWRECSGLRLVLCAGSGLTADTGCELATRTAAEVRTLHLLDGGALTVTADTFDAAVARELPVLGHPVDNVRVLVLDEYGDPVPPGVPGELHVSGLGLARGYLGDPRTTGDRFRPAPYGAPGGRMHRTDEEVRWRNDGTLELLGRAGTATPAVVGTPAAATGSGRPAHVEPGTPAERAVARAWSELLEVGQVGLDDNFFQLGGYSLLLTQLGRRLHEATGAQIVLADLFTAVTVREQAALLAGLTAVPPGGPVPVEAAPAVTETGAAPAVTKTGAALPAITPVPRDRPQPLSSGQHRIWLLNAVDPSPEWAAPLFLRPPANLGAEDVREILDALADRHEVLRTRYVSEQGEIVQIVGERLPIDLVTVEGTRDEIVAHFREQFETPFDLASGRIWRATLARVPSGAPGTPDPVPAEVLLLVTVHHIACDGWSASVLESEFEQLCAARLAGADAELPPVPVQYADYASWQRAWRSKDRLGAELAYWRETLEGLVPLELPIDHPRPATRDPRGSVVTFAIAPHVMEAVTRLGQSRGATPFMTLLTAYGAVLARHSGQWDVVIGTPVADRPRPELDRTVGFFLNSLVLRCRLDGEIAFPEALDRMRDTCRAAFSHQDLSFEHIVDELRPERDPSRTPLYQVAFNLHDGALIGGMPNKADMDYLHPARQVAKTDLTLYVRSEGDGTWTGALEYATALFRPETVQRFAGHFLGLLDSVTEDPACSLGAADMLTGDERRLVLTDWAVGERADWPAGSTLDIVEERVEARPDALAVVSGDTRLSYRELDERANRLAHHLVAAGAGPETVVGVCLDRGPDLLPALLGVWKAGAAYLPLDPGLPAERLRHVLADCAAPLLVTDSRVAAAVAGFAGVRIEVDTDREKILERPATAPPRPFADPDLPAYVIYTSGSTGRPKGVTVHHRGLVNHLRWAARDLAGPSSGHCAGTGAGAPLFSSIAFDLPTTNLYVPLLTGEPLHLLPAGLDLSGLGAALTAQAPYRFVKLTPGHLDLLAEQLTDAQAAGLADRVLVAGEALSARTAGRWLELLGPGRLINEYGPTEASVGSTMHPVDRPYDSAVPLGRPLPNTTTHVLDDRGRPLPVGVAGEMHIGGTGLARGYHGRPELTAEKFVPDPYGPPGARLYRTGDLARLLPDGAVDFLGRIDNQVKLRGYRIELGEIEAELTGLPEVREAVVTVRETATGEKSLVAHVVPADGTLPGAGTTIEAATEIRRQLARTLPEYMVPAALAFIESVPLTANGKVDRRALPTVLPAGSTGTGEDPTATPTEARIAEIWAELLGLPDVGIHDGFFELGGHSILAIRMAARLQDEFDVDLTIGTVFARTTVSRLAAAVEDLITAEIDRLTDAELAEHHHTDNSSTPREQ